MTRKMLLLGATGRTGEAVLNQALDRDWQVTALVRRPEALTPRPGLAVIAGTPLDSSAVAGALEGCVAVISALNNNRTSDSFFAKGVSPPNFMTDSIRNTIAAMRKHGVKRMSILSAAGTGDNFAEMPWLFRMIIKHTNVSHTYRDHDALDALVRKSGLDWTLVRPMRLMGDIADSPPVTVSYGMQPKPLARITRKSVATFLLDSLDDSELIGRAPTISQW